MKFSKLIKKAVKITKNIHIKKGSNHNTKHDEPAPTPSGPIVRGSEHRRKQMQRRQKQRQSQLDTTNRDKIFRDPKAANRKLSESQHRQKLSESQHRPHRTEWDGRSRLPSEDWNQSGIRPSTNPPPEDSERNQKRPSHASIITRSTGWATAISSITDQDYGTYYKTSSSSESDFNDRRRNRKERAKTKEQRREQRHKEQEEEIRRLRQERKTLAKQKIQERKQVEEDRHNRKEQMLREQEQLRREQQELQRQQEHERQNQYSPVPSRNHPHHKRPSTKSDRSTTSSFEALWSSQSSDKTASTFAPMSISDRSNTRTSSLAALLERNEEEAFGSHEVASVTTDGMDSTVNTENDSYRRYRAVLRGETPLEKMKSPTRHPLLNHRISDHSSNSTGPTGTTTKKAPVKKLDQKVRCVVYTKMSLKQASDHSATLKHTSEHSAPLKQASEHSAANVPSTAKRRIPPGRKQAHRSGDYKRTPRKRDPIYDRPLTPTSVTETTASTTFHHDSSTNDSRRSRSKSRSRSSSRLRSNSSRARSKSSRAGNRARSSSRKPRNRKKPSVEDSQRVLNPQNHPTYQIRPVVSSSDEDDPAKIQQQRKSRSKSPKRPTSKSPKRRPSSKSPRRKPQRISSQERGFGSFSEQHIPRGGKRPEQSQKPQRRLPTTEQEPTHAAAKLPKRKMSAAERELQALLSLTPLPATTPPRTSSAKSPKAAGAVTPKQGRPRSSSKSPGRRRDKSQTPRRTKSRTLTSPNEKKYPNPFVIPAV